MTSGLVPRRKLLSFVRSRQEVTEWMEPDFTWAGGMLELAQLKIFEGFEWSSFQSRHGSSVLGIRGDQGGSGPRETSAAGFRIESSVRASPALALQPAEHYLVVELLSTQRVTLSVCVCSPPIEWHVVEERLMTRFGQGVSSPP